MFLVAPLSAKALFLDDQPYQVTLNARVSRLWHVHECPFSFGIRHFAQMRSFNAQLVDAQVAADHDYVVGSRRLVGATG